VRCLHIGGRDSPDFRTVEQMARKEDASDDSRLTYVAMTRAQTQVVAWWSPAFDEPNGGLSRLLRGRRPGEPVVPDRCEPAKISDDDAIAVLREWEAAGGPVLEQSVVAKPHDLPQPPTPKNLGSRHFHRDIDTTWRRTSYSGLIRVAESTGVSSEPEATELDDEVGEIPVVAPPSVQNLPSPMAELPTGARFGTLVHAVLETADPFAGDLAAELQSRIRSNSVWWPLDVAPQVLAAALLPMHDTPLGPLAGGLTLRQIGLRDRLRELDFEFPLAGGDLRSAAPAVRLSDVGVLLREHLPADDPLVPYVSRLTSRALGDQSLRGYLTGSVDAVLRVPLDSGHRYLVVDYKTNWLGDHDRPLTAGDYDRSRMTEAMLHSDYPLQALLYLVVLHRFLRWRQPDYDPADHLGGALYLFVRGMCGVDTPVVDGHPAGVFSWQPPPGLVVALSDVLDEGRRSA
jgi:exodeoxyribonuclease V beta subunit